MPGVIANASPSTVMPQTLLMSFSESRDYETLQNTFHDGTRQIGQLALASRKTFKLTSRLTTAQLNAFRTFWSSLNGGLSPFYYYNPYEGSPVGSNYDATGVSTTGRYTVVFRGDWSQSVDMQRTNIPNVEMVEVQ